MINSKAIIMPILLILSVQGIIGAVVFFNQKSERVNEFLTSKMGQVAGASTTEIIDLTSEIPMIPDAEIISVDTSIDSASITLESSLPIDQIKTYYDDYMLLNSWSQVEQNLYEKEGRQLRIDFTENVVKLTLYKS